MIYLDTLPGFYMKHHGTPNNETEFRRFLTWM